VAFYVMAALGQRLVADGLISHQEVRATCANCLDLVALGTVADLVPLDYNNRILVTQGLRRMRAGQCRPGITALFNAANRNLFDCNTADLGYAIAPRLNAAGRMTDMTVGINCLLADSNAEAARLAGELSRLNEQRREVQASMQAEAEDMLSKVEAGLGQAVTEAICLFEPDWHQGIVGLVATRIRERINRPVIAFAPADSGELLKGSGRSVQGVHMRDVLAGIDAQHPGLMDKYGGHAMAAGLSLPRDNLDAFRAAFADEVARYANQIDEIDRVWSDGELESGDFNLATAEALRHAVPWGQGCPEPVFDGRFEVIDKRVVGGNHLKLKVRQVGAEQTVNGILFNQTELPPVMGTSEYRLAFKLDVNEFRQLRTHQLVVEHIECV
ncbi:MAG: DHHA1 domain-containing protein, partial [Gammaproteobacteria bacterium]